MPPGYKFLALAIISEVVATRLLKSSDGFSRVWLRVSLAFINVAYVSLAKTLETVPLAIAYGIWSGIGIVVIEIIDTVVFGQSLDMLAVGGLALIVIGVVVIYYSKYLPH